MRRVIPIALALAVASSAPLLHAGDPATPTTPAAEAVDAPPEDRLTVAWAAFIKAHPPGTPKAHPELHADIADEEDAVRQIEHARELIEMGIDAEFAPLQIDYGSVKAAADRLLVYSAQADDYRLYARTLQQGCGAPHNVALGETLSHDDLPTEDAFEADVEARAAAFKKGCPARLREGLKALNVALALGHPDRGGVMARAASLRAQLGEMDAAFETLEAATKAGFKGYIWMRMAPELSALRGDRRWRDWYLARLPKEMREAPSEEALKGILSLRRDESTSYTLCADGRYLEEMFEQASTTVIEGRWKITGEGLSLTPERLCEIDDAPPCPALTESDREEGHAPRTLLQRQELVILQRNAGDYTDDALRFKREEPEYCEARSPE